MIVFDLKCRAAHVFEAWFASSGAFAEQRKAGLVVCPVCGDTAIDKAVMAPNVTTKGNRRVATPVARRDTAARPASPPEAIRQAMAMLAAAQAKLLPESEWVGRDFADRARAIHHGDAPAGLIHGQASPAEAEALIDEGVSVMPLLVPVVPPDQRN